MKFAKVLGKDNVTEGFYGQEINPAHWDDEPFEAIVSYAPYSIKWDGDANPLLINDGRFSPAGVLAPKSKADLAFTMHILHWLAVDGTAAIVDFPGVLYRVYRGGAEKKIRKYLIDNNYVDAVIKRKDIEYFANLVSNDQIAENDFNLAVSSYVDPEDTREVIDIEELNQKIARIVKRQSELRTQIDAIVADSEGKNV